MPGIYEEREPVHSWGLLPMKSKRGPDRAPAIKALRLRSIGAYLWTVNGPLHIRPNLGLPFEYSSVAFTGHQRQAAPHAPPRGRSGHLARATKLLTLMVEPKGIEPSTS